MSRQAAVSDPAVSIARQAFSMTVTRAAGLAGIQRLPRDAEIGGEGDQEHAPDAALAKVAARPVERLLSASPNTEKLSTP